MRLNERLELLEQKVTPEHREGFTNLLRLIYRYHRMKGLSLSERKTRLREVLIEHSKEEMERNRELMLRMSPYVGIYYDPDIDYENLDVEWIPANSEKLKNIWDYFRHIVSSVPYRNVVGKNDKFFLRDNSSNTYLGIMALSSPMVSFKKRDEYFGYSQREGRAFFRRTGISPIEFNPNANTIVPFRPFGMFAGGKLMAQCIATDEMINYWKSKYGHCPWGFHTTSIYGKSIQYDRLYEWEFVGKTRGYGSVHLSGININSILRFLESIGIGKIPSFEGGSIGMRQLTEIERTLGGVLGLKGLHFHGIGRGIYCCRTLKRFRLIEWFEGDTEIERRLYRYPNNPRVKHRHISPVSEKYEFWNERWFRKRYESHKGMIRDCHPSDYMYGKHTQTTLDGV